MALSNASHGLEAAPAEVTDQRPSPANGLPRPGRLTLASSAAAPAAESRATASRRIGPVNFAVMNRAEAIQDVVDAVETRRPAVFAFCNMHTFNLARRMPALAGALSRAKVFNDGIGIDLASQLIHGRAFPANLNGTDLTPAVLAGLSRPVRVCLVGSRLDVVERAAESFAQRYPMVQVVDVHDGFFDAAQSESLIDRLQRIEPDLVLVGMGNPRQELWAIDAATRVNSTFLCVGAFLDFASGSIRRAPDLVRRLRGEWLYRLAMEPRRLSGRYLIGGPLFMLHVLRQWFASRSVAGEGADGGVEVGGVSSSAAGSDARPWTGGNPKRGR